MKNLQLPSTKKGQLSLEDLKGKYVVLYFYPKDKTPGCTLEAKDFSALYPKFQELGAEVVGVSKDSLASHEGFTEKYQIPFPLIADEKAELIQAFGVQKKALSPTAIPGAERSTFILNPEGEAIKSYRKVKASGHAKTVLKDLESLL